MSKRLFIIRRNGFCYGIARWMNILNYETRTVKKKNKRAHACKSKESYPNFTPSGYWTLRNCKTLSAKFSRSTSVSLSGGGFRFRNRHRCFSTKCTVHFLRFVSRSNHVEIQNYVALRSNTLETLSKLDFLRDSLFSEHCLFD